MAGVGGTGVSETNRLALASQDQATGGRELVNNAVSRMREIDAVS